MTGRRFWWWADVVSMVVFAIIGFWGVVYAAVSGSETAVALATAALAMSKASQAMVSLHDLTADEISRKEPS